MKLFDYQDKFITDLGKSLSKNNRTIGQLPTGGGKGVILSFIANRSKDKGFTPCIGVHRIEIFQQILRHLIALGIRPGLISPGNKPMPGSGVYLAMVETMKRRLSTDIIKQLGINFFILDEVHFGSYYKLIQSVDSKILGFTATPKSTGKPELKEYFDDLVCGPSVSDLIKVSRLAPAVTYSVGHDFSKVKLKGGEYDQVALTREFDKPSLKTGAVDNYLRLAKDRQALCFNVGIEHSHRITEQLNKAGIRSFHVDGNTPPKERDSIFRAYRDGEIQVICNVAIATTGTDLPDTGCIIQNFATKSLVKHMQTLGRGARVAGGKDNFIVIDMGSNYVRHGTFGEDIDWVEIFNNPKKDKEERKEKKLTRMLCPDCAAVIGLMSSKCPYCGAKISREKAEKIIEESATLKEIRKYRISNLPIQLRRPISQLKYSELIEYSNHMGYSPKWVHVIMGKRRR